MLRNSQQQPYPWRHFWPTATLTMPTEAFSVHGHVSRPTEASFHSFYSSHKTTFQGVISQTPNKKSTEFDSRGSTTVFVPSLFQGVCMSQKSREAENSFYTGNPEFLICVTKNLGPRCKDQCCKHSGFESVDRS